MSGSSSTLPIQLSSSLIGRTVTFRSKHSSDTIVYSGVIDGITSYNMASKMGDITSYNAAVRQADPTVSSDVTTLNYFVIRLDNTTGPQTDYVFALEWIVAGSWTLTDLATVVTIEVYDTPTADHTQILALLRSGNYNNCRITNVSSATN